MLETERLVNSKTAVERRFHISSLPADALRLSRATRSHRRVENRLRWCMDVVFADEQMRARTAHNLAIRKHISLNLIRIDPIPRMGGIQARRLIADTSDACRAQLPGLS